MSDMKHYILSFTTLFCNKKGYALVFSKHHKFSQKDEFPVSFDPWNRYNAWVLRDSVGAKVKRKSSVDRITDVDSITVTESLTPDKLEAGGIIYLSELNNYLAEFLAKVKANEIKLNVGKEGFYQLLGELLEGVSGELVNKFAIPFNFTNVKIISNGKEIARKQADPLYIEGEKSDQKVSKILKEMFGDNFDELILMTTHQQGYNQFLDLAEKLFKKGEMSSADRLLTIQFGEKVTDMAKATFVKAVLDSVLNTVETAEASVNIELAEEEPRIDAFKLSYLGYLEDSLDDSLKRNVYHMEYNESDKAEILTPTVYGVVNVNTKAQVNKQLNGEENKEVKAETSSKEADVLLSAEGTGKQTSTDLGEVRPSTKFRVFGLEDVEESRKVVNGWHSVVDSAKNFYNVDNYWNGGGNLEKSTAVRLTALTRQDSAIRLKHGEEVTLSYTNIVSVGDLGQYTDSTSMQFMFLYKSEESSARIESYVDHPSHYNSVTEVEFTNADDAVKLTFSNSLVEFEDSLFVKDAIEVNAAEGKSLQKADLGFQHTAQQVRKGEVDSVEESFILFSGSDYSSVEDSIQVVESDYSYEQSKAIPVTNGNDVILQFIESLIKHEFNILKMPDEVIVVKLGDEKELEGSEPLNIGVIVDAPKLFKEIPMFASILGLEKMGNLFLFSHMSEIEGTSTEHRMLAAELQKEHSSLITKEGGLDRKEPSSISTEGEVSKLGKSHNKIEAEGSVLETSTKNIYGDQDELSWTVGNTTFYSDKESLNVGRTYREGVSVGKKQSKVINLADIDSSYTSDTVVQVGLIDGIESTNAVREAYSTKNQQADKKDKYGNLTVLFKGVREWLAGKIFKSSYQGEVNKYGIEDDVNKGKIYFKSDVISGEASDKKLEAQPPAEVDLVFTSYQEGKKDHFDTVLRYNIGGISEVSYANLISVGEETQAELPQLVIGTDSHTSNIEEAGSYLTSVKDYADYFVLLHDTDVDNFDGAESVWSSPLSIEELHVVTTFVKGDGIEDSKGRKIVVTKEKSETLQESIFYFTSDVTTLDKTEGSLLQAEFLSDEGYSTVIQGDSHEDEEVRKISSSKQDPLKVESVKNIKDALSTSLEKTQGTAFTESYLERVVSSNLPFNYGETDVLVDLIKVLGIRIEEYDRPQNNVKIVSLDDLESTSVEKVLEGLIARLIDVKELLFKEGDLLPYSEVDKLKVMLGDILQIDASKEIKEFAMISVENTSHSRGGEEIKGDKAIIDPSYYGYLGSIDTAEKESYIYSDNLYTITGKSTSSEGEVETTPQANVTKEYDSVVICFNQADSEVIFYGHGSESTYYDRNIPSIIIDTLDSGVVDDTVDVEVEEGITMTNDKEYKVILEQSEKTTTEEQDYEILIGYSFFTEKSKDYVETDADVASYASNASETKDVNIQEGLNSRYAGDYLIVDVDKKTTSHSNKNYMELDVEVVRSGDSTGGFEETVIGNTETSSYTSLERSTTLSELELIAPSKDALQVSLEHSEETRSRDERLEIDLVAIEQTLNTFDLQNVSVEGHAVGGERDGGAVTEITTHVLGSTDKLSDVEVPSMELLHQGNDMNDISLEIFEYGNHDQTLFDVYVTGIDPAYFEQTTEVKVVEENQASLQDNISEAIVDNTETSDMADEGVEVKVEDVNKADAGGDFKEVEVQNTSQADIDITVHNVEEEVAEEAVTETIRDTSINVKELANFAERVEEVDKDVIESVGRWGEVTDTEVTSIISTDGVEQEYEVIKYGIDQAMTEKVEDTAITDHELSNAIEKQHEGVIEDHEISLQEEHNYNTVVDEVESVLPYSSVFDLIVGGSDLAKIMESYREVQVSELEGSGYTETFEDVLEVFTEVSSKDRVMVMGIHEEVESEKDSHRFVVNIDKGSDADKESKNSIISISDENTSNQTPHRLPVTIYEEDKADRLGDTIISIGTDSLADRSYDNEITISNENLSNKTQNSVITIEEEGESERNNILNTVVTDDSRGKRDKDTTITVSNDTEGLREQVYEITDESSEQGNKERQFIGEDHTGDEDTGIGQLPPEPPWGPEKKDKVWLIIGKQYPAWSGWNPKKTR